MIGLPDGITACLFDLDGVLTSTAAVHQRAWKATFDAFLSGRADGDTGEFTPQDYAAHVDGRPRADGVRAFLESRGIHLPEGAPDDPPDAATVNGVGNHKNVDLLRIIDEQGVQSYPASVRYLEAARDAGLRIGVVTSSANGEHVLAVADLARFVEARVDGLTIGELGLKGKPAPDSFLEGAKRLGARPEQAAVFEDALAGVRAGRDGAFGYVVGVDRAGQADALRDNGADIVVTELDELLEGA
ncbi:beta-phosphoglucomutase family hydrolase [Actinokineospora pegani]|uniref:beta-phosphoglucomutase family hydrolase n=1 Tax=Actinokineospora pegani TaxID=2654637 RepID=UPI0012EAB683|nr:beta-phosphoglucomutase family hydrolase [Actinokineospora pegani]